MGLELQTFDRAADVAPLLTVREISPLRLPADWDGFAERCGCPYLAIAGFIATRALTSFGKGRMRSYEVFIENGEQKTKLAQATVMRRNGQYTFLHRLAVAPELQELWSAAMGAIVSHIGAGRYVYTGVESSEKSRKDEIEALAGVTVDLVKPLVQQSVFFKNWQSWDDYYRGVSTNSKRNYKRAQKEIERLNIVTKRGLAALKELPFLAKCKRNAVDQKQVGFSMLPFKLRFAIRAFLVGDRQFVNVVRSGDKRLSAISGIEFGHFLFYIDGGRSDDRNGAPWYLMLETLKTFYERCPDGVFEMGYFDAAIHDEQAGGGLIRSRRAIQATDAPSSVVQFRFDPGAVG